MARVAGFTLVELMISMLLGLVVVGGATGVILANRQSYRTNEALSQVQESARTAFELLARDVRQAGVTGCDSEGRIANAIKTDAPLPWWRNWVGITGYTGAQAAPAVAFGASGNANRVAGTDSLLLQGIEGSGFGIALHEAASNKFTLQGAPTNITAGDILLACDFDHAAIFQALAYDSTNKSVTYQSGGASRNCTTGLGYPPTCPGSNIYTYAPNSQLARVYAANWYIGNNGRVNEGGRSLYRMRINNAVPEEIVAGVTNLEVAYREQGQNDFLAANAVGNWANVIALRITLTMRSGDQRVASDLAIDAGRLERRFTNIVALRNRVP
jgi:type IV pilus assembly protein PilW